MFNVRVAIEKIHIERPSMKYNYLQRIDWQSVGQTKRARRDDRWLSACRLTWCCCVMGGIDYFDNCDQLNSTPNTRTQRSKDIMLFDSSQQSSRRVDHRTAHETRLRFAGDQVRFFCRAAKNVCPWSSTPLKNVRARFASSSRIGV